MITGSYPAQIHNMKSSAEIRSQFLEFFKSKGHAIVPSAPIVVKNDPTLLFTNAGMNQFKDYFLGNKTAPAARVADTQKCLRVSGKHNDLEEVGVDTYHHTMFEMLGNWSFGDAERSASGYFKAEAIAWSWELLTKVYQIPAENLYVTIFEGDTQENLERDDESFNEWKKWIDEDHILLGNKKDNFWEMGDTGPCGPCTEIHADCRTDEEKKETPGSELVNNDHPQVIEIWNNVFIQYNRKKDGSLESLPARHVDTGMGYERLVRVLQNKTSNYDTDVFSPTIELIESITNKKYAAGDDKASISFRVLADHIRAISFSIADGQLPSNTGAGYVIRRILRRAVRYYYTYLGYQQPLLQQLVPALAKQFENVFPELQQQQDFVARVIKEEEEAFLRTLDKGLKRIDQLMSHAKNQSIHGKDAFELLDTYGFPIDLTRLIAAENNLQVDEPGFEEEMSKQKDRSRAATSLQADDWTIISDENSLGFVGYDSLQTATKILRYRKVAAKNKTQYQLVLSQTPFYAESGGQVGDTGHIQTPNGPITITNTKKENDLIIHFADEIPALTDFEVTAMVDQSRRKKISLHHSVTHLMHAALRQVLGNHVAQKGSLVVQDALRFDFSHFAKTSDEELRQVEKIVNQKIRENIPVVIQTMKKDEAVALGAMALFGEKYGDEVRVVIMDKNYSIELCGGTHAGSTGEIGMFKITSEAAVAAGVRRIEAVCGAAAEDLSYAQFDAVAEVLKQLKTNQSPAKAIEAIQATNASLSKHIDMLEARQLVTIRNEFLKTDQIINGVSFYADVLELPNADAIKKLLLDVKNQVRDHLVVICANIGGKAAVGIGMSETVAKTKNLNAAAMIKEIVAPAIKGGGGGSNVLATAGGQSVNEFEKIIQTIKEKLSAQ